MVRRFPPLLPFLLLAVLAVAARAGAEPPRITVLKNGLTVAVVPDDRFPLVSIRLFVHAGSGYERPEEAGISHLLEHMVFKTTEKRAAGAIAKEIEGAGGDLNASTSFDATIYKVDLPSDRLDLGLDVIKDMIFGARFDPEELRSEKEVVLSELDRGLDDPDNRLFQTLQAQLWPKDAYGWPIIGFRDTVSAVTSQDLKDYIAHWYQPRSMVLTVVGKVDPEAVTEKARELFGDLTGTRDLAPPASLPPAGGGPEIKIEFGKWNKVYLMAAFPTPGIRSTEEPGLDVLAQTLGGDETSRLYRRFKYEKRLVDDISLGSMTLKRGGALYLTATLDADKLMPFWRELTAFFAGLPKTSFSPAEIDRARLNLEDGLYRAKETLAGLAGKFGSFLFYGYGPEGEANYVKALAGVNQTVLAGLVRDYLSPERLRLAVLAPSAEEGKLSEKALAETLAASWPSRGAGQALARTDGGVGQTEVVELPGGRKLVLLPDATLPYLSVSVTMDGGDALLAPTEQGLAEWTANLLVRGTKKRPATAIEDFLADRAASVSAASGRDLFTLDARGPSRFEKDILGLLAEIVAAPAFDPKEAAKEVQNQLAAIKQKQDEPMGLAFRKLFPFLYAGGPYAYTRLGEPERVAAFKAPDAARFWKRQTSMPWTMAVCGAFDREAVLALARELSGLSPRPGTFAFETPTWGEKRQETVTLPGRNQEHLMWVFPVAGAVSDDTAGLELLNAALAGQGGVLFRELRDGKGLGYSVTSFLWQTVHTGFLAFYIGTTPERAEEALAGFRDVAARLIAEPLPEADLSRAKNVLWGDYYRDRQSLKARSEEAARLSAQGFPLDRELTLIEKSKSLDAAAVRDLAARYLDPSKAYLMRVKP